MSKARKRLTAERNREQWIFPDCPEPRERPADQVDADVLRATTGTASELPREVMKALRSGAAAITRPCRSDTAWNGFKEYTLRQRLWAHVREENEFIAGLVMDGVERGFRLAVERYAKQLRNVPELAAWRQKRKVGGDVGRAKSSRRSEDLAQRIREKWAAMEAAGEKVTNDTVAAAMKNDGWKCSRSTVIRAFKEKPARRTKR